MRVDPNRYFNLEGLPSESIQTLFETVIWERGKTLSPSSLNSELTYFNNIREFVIDKGITELKLKDEERILRMLKGWMLERGYALSSKKYCPVYDRVKIE